VNVPTPYEMIGGDAKLRAIVDRFYDLMELEPRYVQLRAAHGSTLEHAREKLYMERDQWMACMGQALEEMEVPEPFRLGLLGNLFKTADWMRNK
jgi:hemoglobin